MNYTSIEQSKKLLNLGLKAESADMYYPYVLPHSDKIEHNPEIGDPLNALEWYNKGYTFNGKEPLTLDEYCIPCWSVGQLLSIMPKVSRIGYQKCYPQLEHDSLDRGYRVKSAVYDTLYYNTPIEACFDMIVWLLQNNYLKDKQYEL